MSIRVHRQVTPDERQEELPFESGEYTPLEERFAGLPPAERSVAVIVEYEREPLRLALAKASSVADPDRKQVIEDMIGRYAGMTWREIAEAVAALGLSGKKTLPDGSPNIPFSEAARIAVAKFNKAWRTYQDMLLEEVLVKAMNPLDPDAVKARLDAYPAAKRAQYAEIGRNLMTLSGRELLDYACAIGLSTENAERIDWTQKLGEDIRWDEKREGPEWAFGGPQHAAYANKIRRSLFLYRLNHMIMAGVTPQESILAEVAERRQGMEDVLKQFRTITSVARRTRPQ